MIEITDKAATVLWTYIPPGSTRTVVVEFTITDLVHCAVLCRMPSTNKSEQASPVFLCTPNEEDPLSLAGQKASDDYEPRPLLIEFMTKHAQKASLFTALIIILLLLRAVCVLRLS